MTSGGISVPYDETAAWAASGAMALTARPGEPPLAPGWSIAMTMKGLAARLSELGGPSVDGPALLGERAAFSDLHARGAIAPGGTCHFVRSGDDVLAVNLARPSDPMLANAWLDDAGVSEHDPWVALAVALAARRAAPSVERAAELGLAVGRLGEVDEAAPDIELVARVGSRPEPLVVDLSSLWSGPLCAQLLGLSGARVVKVESVERPDASRVGLPEFFDLLHHSHESVALEFTNARGRDALRSLIGTADVVIEASRPRALEQLGIDAALEVARGAVWVSLTAYGRSAAGRIGFGDDVGAAAGIHAGDHAAPIFCGDAIGDPVSGLYAAVSALAALRHNNGRLVDVSMAAAARLARGDEREPERAAELRPEGWFIDDIPVARPRARVAPGRARAFGADTDRVMSEIGVRRWV